jgi:hypothetical protein
MRNMQASRAIILMAALAVPAASINPAFAATACSKDGFCYCIHDTLSNAIVQKLAEIRALIAAQKAQGKTVGYLSIPLSTLNGGYFGVNTAVAAETKERVEQQLGVHDVWVLNPGAAGFSLPVEANGADYMWMWTQVLEGDDGLGAFDFAYFTGPTDFAHHFGLDGHADLEKLDTAYDDLSKTAPDFAKTVDKRSFRDYYGLRLAVSRNDRHLTGSRFGDASGAISRVAKGQYLSSARKFHQRGAALARGTSAQ